MSERCILSPPSLGAQHRQDTQICNHADLDYRFLTSPAKALHRQETQITCQPLATLDPSPFNARRCAAGTKHSNKLPAGTPDTWQDITYVELRGTSEFYASLSLRVRLKTCMEPCALHCSGRHSACFCRGSRRRLRRVGSSALPRLRSTGRSLPRSKEAPSP